MIRKLLEAFGWTPEVPGRDPYVNELGERVATLEFELAKLIKRYGEQEGVKSPDYHG